MGDSKLRYQRSLMVQKHDAEYSNYLARKIRSAKRRYKEHKDEMRPVDLNEVIDKYAPGSTPYFKSYKIDFHTEGSDYVVSCDPSGYLRILNIKTNGFVDYYTGKTLTGQEGFTKAEINKMTHFRIKRREEMK